MRSRNPCRKGSSAIEQSHPSFSPQATAKAGSSCAFGARSAESGLSSPSARAAARTSLDLGGGARIVEVHQHGDRARPSAPPRASSSRRLAPSSPNTRFTPVTLAPGRLRLSTSPILTAIAAAREHDRDRRRRGLGGKPGDCRRRSRRGPPRGRSTSSGRHAPAAGRIGPPPSGIRPRRSCLRRSRSRPSRGEIQREPPPTSARERPLRKPITGSVRCCARASQRRSERRRAQPRDDLPPPCMSGKEHSEG